MFKSRPILFGAIILSAAMALGVSLMRAMPDGHPIAATVGPLNSGGVTIGRSDARCDGKTDDTLALNGFLSRLRDGTTVYLGAGQFCVLSSGNLVVPPGTRIVGSGRAIQPSGVPGRHTGSGFILAPRYTIRMETGSALENLGIWRSGLVAAPSADEVIAAVKAWGLDNSVAVTIPPNVGGVHLSSLFIEGFNTAVHAYSGQLYISQVWGDDYNGIEVSSAGDNTYVENSRFEPFYSFGVQPPSVAWNRPGIAFYANGGDTGLYMSHDFAFCWQNGLLVDGVGVSGFSHMTLESCESQGRVSAATGVRFINGSAATSLSDSFVSGYRTGVSIESGDVGLFNTYVSSPSVAAFYLAGGYAEPVKISFGGHPRTGDIIRATLKSPEIEGSPVTVSYQVGPDVSPERIAAGLQRAINAQQNLVAARVSALVLGKAVQIDWPANLSIRTSVSGTGELVAKLNRGVPITPGSGIVSAARTNRADVPMFIIGNSAAQSLSWTISNPILGNGTQPLPGGWLQVPTFGNASTKLITVNGVQWSRVFPANVSGCGAGATVSAGATDGDGTVFEGTQAKGCQITFTTPFFEAPECLVTGPTGTILQGFHASRTKLTISHPVADKATFAYHCRPG